MGKMRDTDNVFSRSQWNKFVEVAEWYQRTKERGELGRRGSRRTHDSNVVTVKNSSGGNLPMGSVVEFTDYLLNDNELGQRMVRMDAVESTGKDRWGILNLPLKAGERGACQISGSCVARVSVTNTSHRFARVVSGETHLVSDHYGDAVLDYPPSSTGVQLLAVNLRPAFKIFTGVVSQSGGIASGATGTVLLSTGETKSVKNPFGDVDESSVVMVAEVDGILQLWFPGDGGGGGTDTTRIWVEFSLTEDMDETTPLQAAAVVLDSWGTGAPAATAVITVLDPQGAFGDSVENCVGIASNAGTAGSPAYHIVRCQRVAEWAFAEQDEQTDMDAGDDPTLETDTLDFMDVGENSMSPPEADCEFTNPYNLRADAGAKLLLHRNRGVKVGGKWIYEVVCVTPPKAARVGVLLGSLSQGGTATATEIVRDGAAWVNGSNFTVTDFFLNVGETVPADTKLIAHRIDGVWVPITYCAASDTLPEEQ